MATAWWPFPMVLVAGVVTAMTAATAAVTSAQPAGANEAAPAPTLACDDLDSALCLLPFPNDVFTVADPTTATGRRVHLDATSTPVSQFTGRHVDPTSWNRNDGFSPGSPILTYVPGIDLHKTWGTSDEPHSAAAPNELGYFDYRDQLADIERYRAPDAPIVLLDAGTGERVPFWSGSTSTRSMTPNGPAPGLHRPRPAAAHRAPGGQPHRGAPVRRRPATPEERRRRGHPGEQRIRRVPRRAGRRRPDGAPGLTLRHAVPSRRPAAGPLPHLGLHGGLPQSLSAPVLHMRDEAFAQLGDTDLADLRVQGTRRSSGHRGAGPRPGDEQRHRPTRRGHGLGPQLPQHF